LATRFGLLCSWIRILKSSTLFCFKISFISSGFNPNSSKYDLCSEMSFGRFFFVSSKSCFDIFSRGTSVSGYIRAAPGIGRWNFDEPSGRAPRTSDLQDLVLMHSCWRSISLSIVVVIIFGSWNPFISTRLEPLIEMFTSCLMVPIPRLTLQARRISPIFRAASLISSGVCMCGPVAISTRGIPSRSNL